MQSRETEFDRWLYRSRPGDRRNYHTGFLLLDRVGDSLGNRKQLHDEASSAWFAYLQSQVHLIQRKLDDGIYEYIAERR